MYIAVYRCMQPVRGRTALCCLLINVVKSSWTFFSASLSVQIMLQQINYFFGYSKHDSATTGLL